MEEISYFRENIKIHIRFNHNLSILVLSKKTPAKSAQVK
jgi:hypothetical protein